MAFNATYLQLYTTQYNLNSLSAIPKLWGYATSVDNIATVSANGYFDAFANFALNNQAPGAFAVGDQINCSCTDGNIGLQVTQITPIVETLPFIQAGTVTTSDIANQAVTAAKIANATITTTQISGSAAITGAQLAAGANIAGTQLAAAANIAGSQLAAAAGIVGTQLTAGTLTNTQVNASAAIAFSKLASLTSANILVGSGANVATSVAMSGDATLANTGALTIANSAITNAKVAAAAAIDFSKLAALASGNIIVGSAGTVPTSVAMSGDVAIIASGATTIQAAAVTSAKLDPSTIQYVKVPMTAAQWNGMYATPYELIAAPGSNKAIIIRGLTMSMTFVSASYANGGAIICQYDASQVHGAGINACGTGTIAAAAVNGFGASASFGLVGQLPVAGAANSTFVNKDVCLSNATGPFITGDGTWQIHVWFEIVTL